MIAVTSLNAGATDCRVMEIRGDCIPLLRVAIDGALRRAWPYRDPTTDDLGAVTPMHTDGRRRPLHRDGVPNPIRLRR